jgi:hypothetical protein
MAADIVFGIQLKADGSGFVGTVRASREEIERLREAARGLGPAMAGSTAEMTKAVAIGSQIGRFLGDAAKSALEWGAATVTAAAELKDLADATGSSVADLSRLVNVAKISGLSMGELEIASQRLSVNLAGTDDESKKASRALTALGVSTKDPAQAMEQLAQKLSQYRDGAEKAALVQEILGRGAQRLLPYLKDLAEQYGVAATVSTRQAQAAEELEKSLRALAVQTNALRDAFLGDLVPALVELIAQFNSGIRIAGGFWAALNNFGSLPAMKSIADVRQAIAAVEKDVQDATSKRGNWWDRLFGGAEGSIDIATKKLQYLGEQLARFQRQDAALRAQEDRGFDPRQIAPITPARAKAVVDPLVKELDRLEERWRNLLAGEQAHIDPQTIKSLEELDKLLDTGRIRWDEYVAGIAKAVDADKVLTAEQKELNDALRELAEIERGAARFLDEYADALQRDVDAARHFVESLEDQNTQLRDEVAVIGLTGTARELRISQLERERAVNAATSDVQRQRINQLYDERDALIATKGAAQDYADAQRAAFTEADRIARDAFGAIFDSGDDAFRRLGDSLKRNVIDALYQVVVRPWVIQLVASMTGGNVGALTSLVGGGQGSGLLNLFGGGNSGGLFNSFATSGIGQSLGLSSVPAVEALAEGGMVTAVDAMMVSAGEAVTPVLTGFGSALSAAIPYIGLATAALGLFSSALFKHEPSQVRGRFQVSPGTEGFEDSVSTSTRFGNLGFSDADTAQFSGEAAQVFNKIVSGALDAFEQRYTPEQSDRLASILQSTDFGSQEGTFTTEEFLQKYGGEVLQQVVVAAFDVLDPALGAVAAGFKGTADEVAKFGNTLLGIYDVTQQIGNADFTANVLAALGDGTQETADKLAAFVTVVGTVGDSFDGLGARLQQLDPESIVAFVDALGGAQTVMQSFAFLNQNFTTAAERAEAAQSHLTKAWSASKVTTDDLAKAALTTFPRTHAEFMRLFNSLDLNTEHGRELANALLNEVAPAFVAVEGSADAAAEALKRQADAGRDYYNEHFLTPEEQTRQRQTVDSTALYEMSKEGTTLNRVLRELGVEQLPLTIQGVRSLYNATVAKYGADSEETAALLRAIPVIGDLIDSVDGFADSAASAAEVMQRAWEQINEQTDAYAVTLDRLGSLAGAAPDFGSQLEDAVLLYSDQITKLNAKIVAALAKGQFSQVEYVYRPELAQVTQLFNQASARLQRYNELVALYGATQAEQLQQLEERYKADQALYSGNTAALNILKDNFIEAWTAIRTGATEAAASLDEFIKSIQSLADSTRGNAGQQARLELALSDARLNELQVQYAAALPGSALATALAADIEKLKAYNTGLETQLAHFTTYAGQYGVDAANQLVQLENEFASWQQQVGDNAGALAVLQEIFDDQWKAIIDSLKGGVDGSLEELARLKQGIAEYLQSLYVSDISPLSPQEKLQQASAAYERELQLAKGGDLKALGDITQYADTLLQLDRDFYKSSDAFVAEFNRITEDLASLAGTLPNGLPVPTGDPASAFAAALPVGSPIASAADIQKNTDATVAQTTLIQQLITALANANTEDARLIAETLQQQQQALADAAASSAK